MSGAARVTGPVLVARLMPAKSRLMEAEDVGDGKKARRWASLMAAAAICAAPKEASLPRRAKNWPTCSGDAGKMGKLCVAIQMVAQVDVDQFVSRQRSRQRSLQAVPVTIVHLCHVKVMIVHLLVLQE